MPPVFSQHTKAMKKTVIILPTLRSPSFRRLCICIACTHDPSARMQLRRLLHWQPPAIASGTGTEAMRLQCWHKTYAYVNMPRIASHVVVVPSCSFLTLPALPPLAHWLLRWRCLRRWRQNNNQRLIIATININTDKEIKNFKQSLLIAGKLVQACRRR